MSRRSTGTAAFGGWRALLFIPLMAALLWFSFPAALKQGAKVRLHLQASPEAQFRARTTGYGPLIREVQRRVPPDQPILIRVPTRANPLYLDRIVDYWLYPRKIYSVKALRLAGEDIREFARARGIRWRYQQGRLENLADPGPPPDRDHPPCSLHSGGRARVATGILLALIHFLLVGACVVSAVDRDRLIGSRIERLAVSYLVGIGAVGFWTALCFVTGIGVRLWTVFLSLPLALIFLWLVRWRTARRLASAGELRGDSRERGNPAGRASGSPAVTGFRRLDRFAALLAVVLLGVLVLRAVAMPMGGYDDRYLWAHKAHIMLHESSVWDSGFQDPQTLQSHPQYPLLIPGVEAVVFLYAGGFNDQYVTLLFPLFLGALLVVLYRGLKALGRPGGGGLAALALLLVPAYWGYGIERDGAGAFAAYPDLPLSAFAATAMIFLLRARERRAAPLYLISALLLLFCGLSKSEGTLHFAVFVAVAFAPLALGIGRHPQLRSALVPFAAVGLVIALYELAVVQPTQPGFLPDDYSEFFGRDRIAANLGRLPGIARMLASDYFLSARFGLPGLVLGAAALLFLRSGSGSQALRPLCYVGLLLALYCGPYLLLPEEVWRSIYHWSAGRLVLQLVPMSFLAASLLILPRRDSHRDPV